MKIITDPRRWKETMYEVRESGASIGFVPTMGALHQGHLSLIRMAKEQSGAVAVSIFVNPTQFNDPKDLRAYPSTLETDQDALRSLGVEYLFLPSYEALYPDGYTYSIEEHEISRRFCGASRPGHFTGVLTVVMKLLLLTGADRAYFGEKDWQQYRLIEGMCEAFFLDTKIIPAPLIREASGLALSSRNMLLSEEDRALAPSFHAILSSGKSVEQIISDLEQAGFIVDYVQQWEDRLLGAVMLSHVRLIDNVRIRT